MPAYTINENGLITAVHGLSVSIQAKAGSYRTKQGKQPILMSDHYGEIDGTKGADNDPLDCYIGPYPESENVYIINQQTFDGRFDEHKVMFGFIDQDHAVNVYRLGCFDRQPLSVVSCTVAQFKWWIENGNHKAEITPQSLPFDTYSEIAMQQFKDYDWQNASAAASRVLYDMRVMDSAYGQLVEPMDFTAIIDEVTYIDGGEFSVMDALVIPNNQIEKKANQIGIALNRQSSGDIKVIDDGGVEVTEPYRQNGTTNVAMIFTLSDGQTVSVFLHNPDATPKKLAPTDNLVSWKWLLNKKDITIVVAKENGQDQAINTIAKKIMALVEANSAKFQRTNAKAAELEAEIKATEARIEEKKNVLQGLLDQIASLEISSSEIQPEHTLEALEQPNSNVAVVGLSELDQSSLLPLDISQAKSRADIEKAMGIWLAQLQGKTIITVDGKTVRFSKKSKKHLITDSLFERLFVPMAVTKVPEVFTSGDFIERQELNKVRNDVFVAFHVYRKWVDVGDKQVHLQVKAAEMADGHLEAEMGLIAYTAKEVSLDDASNGKEPSRAATFDTANVPFAQSDSLENDNATLDSVQDEEIYFIEILEVRDAKQKSESLKNGTSSNQNQPIQFIGNELGDFDVSTIDGKKHMREAARKVLENLRGKWVKCPAMPRDENGQVREVEIRNRSIKEFISHSGNPIKILLAAKIEAIIETAKNAVEEENFKTHSKPYILRYYKLENEVRVKGDAYLVEVIIEQDTNGYLHYDVMLPNKAKAALDSAALQLEPVPTPKAGASNQFNNIVFDDIGQEVSQDSINLVVKKKNSNGEWVELEDTVEPEEVGEPSNDSDRAFLQEVIEGLVDVMSDGFHEHLFEVASRYGTGDNTEMLSLVEQAVNAYTVQLDELSQ